MLPYDLWKEIHDTIQFKRMEIFNDKAFNNWERDPKIEPGKKKRKRRNPIALKILTDEINNAVKVIFSDPEKLKKLKLCSKGCTEKCIDEGPAAHCKTDIYSQSIKNDKEEVIEIRYELKKSDISQALLKKLKVKDNDGSEKIIGDYIGSEKAAYFLLFLGIEKSKWGKKDKKPTEKEESWLYTGNDEALLAADSKTNSSPTKADEKINHERLLGNWKFYVFYPQRKNKYEVVNSLSPKTLILREYDDKRKGGKSDKWFNAEFKFSSDNVYKGPARLLRNYLDIRLRRVPDRFGNKFPHNQVYLLTYINDDILKEKEMVINAMGIGLDPLEKGYPIASVVVLTKEDSGLTDDSIKEYVIRNNKVGLNAKFFNIKDNGVKNILEEIKKRNEKSATDRQLNYSYYNQINTKIEGYWISFFCFSPGGKIRVSLWEFKLSELEKRIYVTRSSLEKDVSEFEGEVKYLKPVLFINMYDEKKNDCIKQFSARFKSNSDYPPIALTGITTTIDDTDPIGIYELLIKINDTSKVIKTDKVIKIEGIETKDSMIEPKSFEKDSFLSNVIPTDRFEEFKNEKESFLQKLNTVLKLS